MCSLISGVDSVVIDWVQKVLLQIRWENQSSHWFRTPFSSSLQLTLNTRLDFSSHPHPDKISYNTSEFSFCLTQPLLFEAAAFCTCSRDLKVTDVLYTNLFSWCDSLILFLAGNVSTRLCRIGQQSWIYSSIYSLRQHVIKQVCQQFKSLDGC